MSVSAPVIQDTTKVRKMRGNWEGKSADIPRITQGSPKAAHLSSCCHVPDLRPSQVPEPRRMAPSSTLACSLVLLALLGARARRTADQALEAAEDEAMAQQPRGLGERMVDRLAAVNVDGGTLDVSAAVDWASELRQLRLGDDAYTDDVLPYIAVGDAAATLLEAPGENGLAVLRRKQLYSGLEVDVLESQLVVLHGTEKPEERRRREAAGIGPENLLASQLACRPINGSAMFMLAHRWADRVEGAARGSHRRQQQHAPEPAPSSSPKHPGAALIASP